MNENQTSAGIHYVCIATTQNSVNILPFFFDTHKISFCVYNLTPESFYITQTANGIIQSPEPSTLQGHRSVKIQHYTHFLNQLLAVQTEEKLPQTDRIPF